MLRATPIRPRPAVAGKCAPGKPQALTEQGRSPISPALFLQPLLTQRRGRGVLRSSAYRRVEDRAMLLLGNPCSRLKLLLATAVHVVGLISKVCVPTFAAIELVPLPMPVKQPDEKIVAISAMDDIRAPASVQPSGEPGRARARSEVVAVAPVEHIIARVAVQHVSARSPVEHVLAPVGELYARIPAPAPQLVVTRRAVDDIAAVPSEDVVYTTEAVYLVLTILTVQIVCFVGAGEHAAFVGAAGYVVGDIDRFWVSGLYGAISYSTDTLELFDGPSSLASVFFRCCLR